jgi:tetratricopeptide (TPR) repeat protein
MMARAKYLLAAGITDMKLRLNTLRQRRVFLNPHHLGVASAISIVFAILMSGCVTTTPGIRRASDLSYPSPFQGPGQPAVDRDSAKLLESAWSNLLMEQYGEARTEASRVAHLVQARLLLQQVDFEEEKPELVPRMTKLAEENPDYASAWLTLSVVAEATGDEIVALAAAQKGAQLWSNRRWQNRVDDLTARWVTDRITAAAELLDRGHSEGALERVEPAITLQPNNTEALLLKSRALIDLDKIDDAEHLLVQIEQSSEATWLVGRIAEQRRDWLTAMDVYESLPEDFPGRNQCLHKVRLQWRLEQQPPWVQRALTSDSITRADLAVLLIALAPEIELLEALQIPVLSDIVELPSQREILAVVRAGLIETDPVEPKFFPNRLITVEQFQRAVNRLAQILGVEAPTWCTEDGVVSSPCTVIPDQLNGQYALSVLAGLTGQREL